MRPVIALITDFGLHDSYVGTLKGVIAGIAPDANVIDVSHGVPPQDIHEGAFQLLLAHRAFPPATVFCGVVDPGVGSERRAVAVRARGDGVGPFTFVGPDNGLATGMLVDTVAEACVVLDEPRYHRPVVSSTFHGRDVFAPVAAHLAAGVPLEACGRSVDAASLVRLPWRDAKAVTDGFEAEILHHDPFGNLITNLKVEQLGGRIGAWRVWLDSVPIGPIHRSFSDVGSGRPLAYVGSSGHVEVAVRDGSALRLLDVGPTTRVLVRSVD